MRKFNFTVPLILKTTPLEHGVPVRRGYRGPVQRQHQAGGEGEGNIRSLSPHSINVNYLYIYI